MFYVYILYSVSADRYYIGHTDDPQRRLEEHNTVIKNSYTSRYRPWVLCAAFPVSESRGEAMKAEKILKKLRSRRTLESLIKDNSKFDSILTKVRAVPTFPGKCRD